MPAARRLGWLPAWTRIGAVYFALVFGAGFLLGVLRVPLLEPVAGARAAQLLEMPLMAGVVVLAARWLVQRERPAVATVSCLAAGVMAAAGVAVADLLVGLVLRGMSAAEVLAARDPAVTAAYWAVLAGMAAVPSLLARGASARAA